MLEQSMNNSIDKSATNSLMSQFAGWFSDPSMLIFFFLLTIVFLGDGFGGFGGFGAPGGFLGGLFADPSMIILIVLVVLLLFPGIL